MNSQVTVLVTGSDGFIGRHLVPYLAAQEYKVIAASRTASIFEGSGITNVPLPDLSMPFDWQPLLEQCDAVVHLAGIAHTFANDDLYDRVNHQATEALARAASRCGTHMVFISSIAAQSGSFSDRELTEDDFPRPNNAYGRSKLVAEQAVRAARGFVYDPAARRDLWRRRKRKLRDRPQDIPPSDSIAVRRIDGSTIRPVGSKLLFRGRNGSDRPSRARRNVHRIGSDAAYCVRRDRRVPRSAGTATMAFSHTRNLARAVSQSYWQECNMATDRLPAHCAADKTARARLETVLTDSCNPAPRQSQARLRLTLLLCFHIITCCLSLYYVAYFYAGYQIAWFDEAGLFIAALSVVPFAFVSLLFTFGRFSFGYFVGFYFYTMILGYLWLAAFSKFHYDHTLASASAVVSALAFLAPALFLTAPIKQRFVLSPLALDRLLSGILVLAAAIIAVGTFYNFRLVGLADIYSFRGALEFPHWIGYAIGAISGALLPFAFACFVARGNRWRAAVVLLLLLLIYPITLTKLALFAPFWLLYVALLSSFFEARTTVVLSLFLPVLAGILLALLVGSGALRYDQIANYFGAVNFRMIAIPSIALDVYNDFFSTHDHTYFCQISFLKSFVNCPYIDPLSVIMAKTYQLGNLNASLFATEGTASVGPMLAPLAAFACGLAVALGNGLSSGLSPKFILLSGGVLAQVLLNVPLTTTLLTGGAALLFLLWYLTPRTMFRQNSDKQIAN